MKEKIEISGNGLKMIAVVTMLIDHIAAALLFNIVLKQGTGGVVYSVYAFMRSIGRIAFPIYCFLLVEGFQKTRNRKKYAFRLLLFAFLSEIPFDLAFYGTFWNSKNQNVFITLLLGFFVMATFEKIEKSKQSIGFIWVEKIFILALVAGFSEWIFCDYGAYGVVAIALLYLFRCNKKEQIVAGCISFLWELPALLAFIPIGFYKGKRGFQMKYFFYFFYPVHLLFLYGIRCLWLL